MDIDDPQIDIASLWFSLTYRLFPATSAFYSYSQMPFKHMIYFYLQS